MQLKWGGRGREAGKELLPGSRLCTARHALVCDRRQGTPGAGKGCREGLRQRLLGGESQQVMRQNCG